MSLGIYYAYTGVNHMSQPNISQDLENTFASLTPPVESLQILRELQAQKPKIILELGVGNGYISNELARNGHTVTGMDLFDGPLNMLDSNVLRVKFDIERDDVPAELQGKFDVVLALAILEHVRDENAVLKRIKQMLKPTGVLYASTPNINWWPFRIKYFLGKTVDDFHTCDHIKFWNLARFAQIFSDADFRVSRQFTSTGILNPFWPFIKKSQNPGYEISGKWLFLESKKPRPVFGYNQVVVAALKRES